MRPHSFRGGGGSQAIRSSAPVSNRKRSPSALPPHPSACQLTAAALAVGEDPCAAEALRDYDLAWHIAAIFIVLAASAAGAYSPIALGAVRSSAVATAVRLGSYFGARLVWRGTGGVGSLGTRCSVQMGVKRAQLPHAHTPPNRLPTAS